jgi:hypothetical protein
MENSRYMPSYLLLSKMNEFSWHGLILLLDK